MRRKTSDPLWLNALCRRPPIFSLCRNRSGAQRPFCATSVRCRLGVGGSSFQERPSWPCWTSASRASGGHWHAHLMPDFSRTSPDPYLPGVDDEGARECRWQGVVPCGSSGARLASWYGRCAWAPSSRGGIGGITTAGSTQRSTTPRCASYDSSSKMCGVRLQLCLRACGCCSDKMMPLGGVG